LSDTLFGDALSDGVDLPGDLVAHDRWEGRGVWVETHTRHDVGEIHTGGLDLDADFTGTRFGVGGLAEI
jgi:hypothetical protein